MEPGQCLYLTTCGVRVHTGRVEAVVSEQAAGQWLTRLRSLDNEPVDDKFMQQVSPPQKHQIGHHDHAWTKLLTNPHVRIGICRFCCCSLRDHTLLCVHGLCVRPQLLRVTLCSDSECDRDSLRVNRGGSVGQETGLTAQPDAPSHS